MRVGFQPPVGVDVEAFPVHQEFLTLGPLLEETSSFRDDGPRFMRSPQAP